MKVKVKEGEEERQAMNLYKVTIGVPPIVLEYFCVSENFNFVIDKVLRKAQEEGFYRMREADIQCVEIVCGQDRLVGV